MWYQPQLPHTVWGTLAEPQRGQTLRDGSSSFQAAARRLRLLLLEVFFFGTAIVLVLESRIRRREQRPARSEHRSGHDRKLRSPHPPLRGVRRLDVGSPVIDPPGLDDLLASFAGLVGGVPTPVDGRGIVTLAPGVAPPRLLIGGASAAARRRIVAHDADWFLPAPTAVDGGIPAARALLDQLGPRRHLTVGAMVAVTDDPGLPPASRLRELLTDPAGRYGIPPDAADGAVLHGTAHEVGAALVSLGAQGADRVVLGVVAGDWAEQAALIADVLGLPARHRSCPVR